MLDLYIRKDSYFRALMHKHLKTWIEISEKAISHNIGVFRGFVGPKVKLAAVVKSNAYGHGLIDFSKLAAKHGAQLFCVDSVFEGDSLREAGMKKPILVLGMTLSDNYQTALKNDLILTISNFGALERWLRAKIKPAVHIKIDTGMHRQGFFPHEVRKVIPQIAKSKSQMVVKGVYTHFSSAKDINYPTYTEMQFKKFQEAIALFEKAGFTNLTRHCAASSSTMLNSKYHLDMVRVGMGLYGQPPSKEIGVQLPQIKLKPVMRWKTIVSEIKKVSKSSFIGYDLTERLTRDTKVGILPIGYWHGLPWALSNVGEVVINKKRAKILGRVTMDVTMVDVTDIPCKLFDVAEVDIMDGSFRTKTSHYEFLARINPLIQRIIV